MRSKVKGAGRIRKLLRRLPDAISAEILAEMRKAGATILGRAKAETPRRTAQAAGLLTAKVYDKTLRLRVGLLGKAANRKAWYLRIVEAGRRAQTVQVKRRTPSGSIARYALRVKPINRSRYDIVRGRTVTFARQLLKPVLTAIYERALKKAAAGAGGDD